MTEPATVVREAFERLCSQWPDRGAPPPAEALTRFLDGVDHKERGAAALLLRVHTLGLVELIRHTSRTADAWRRTRSVLVTRLVCDAFIRQEMAEWAIDAWGASVLGTTIVSFPQLPAAGERGRAPGLVPAATPRPMAAAAPATHTVGGPRTSLPLASPSPMQRAATPSPSASTRATAARTRRSSHHLPAVARPRPVINRGRKGLVSSLIAVACTIVGIGGMVAANLAGTGRINPVAAPIPPRQLHAMNGMRATPLGPWSAATSPAVVDSPAEELIVANRGSRSLLERISTSALPPLTHVIVLRVRPPTRAQGAAGPGAKALRRAAERHGMDGVQARRGDDHDYAGLFRVRYVLEDMSGTEDCRAVRPPAGAFDFVRVAHDGDAERLRLTVLGGAELTAVVDESGRFNTVPVIVEDQEYTSSAFTTRLSGRLTAGRLEAEATVLAYRHVRVGRDQACQLTLTMIGERVEDTHSPIR